MSPRLWYILGGAVMGALLGAVYANYAFTVTNRPEMFVEVVPYDDVISEAVESEAAYKAANEQEVTTESESGNPVNP